MLRLSGYPNFVMSQTISSIGLAIAFPRIIIGIFAIIDTFLVFKIAQRVNNTKVALFASLLFAVSPMTWQLRLITLDNIAMPFLLTSILVSLSIQTWNKKWKFHRHIILVLLSGTLLGLAMLTKVPLFTMIPLVGYLVYKNSKKGFLSSVLIISELVLYFIGSWRYTLFNVYLRICLLLSETLVQILVAKITHPLSCKSGLIIGTVFCKMYNEYIII